MFGFFSTILNTTKLQTLKDQTTPFSNNSSLQQMRRFHIDSFVRSSSACVSEGGLDLNENALSDRPYIKAIE